MRISLLLQREPFGDILEKTLANFLQDRFGKPYEVRWNRSNIAERSNNDQQIWLCNQYLNAIFVPRVNRQALLPVIQEFSRSTKPWRTPLQKLYVWLATTCVTSRMFARANVEISPPLNNANKMIIVGGNHHIRILDYEKGCCFIINKNGFDKKYLSNEIKVRAENPYLPTPSIRQIADGERWYSEDLILGTPINRLKNPSDARDAVKNVIPYLFKLYENTNGAVKVKDYVGKTVASIEMQIANIKYLDEHEKNNLLSDLRNLVKAINSVLRNGHNEIVTVQTHGDFQPANILVGDDQTWLIDWEYTARRQIAYDGLVYSLSSRFPLGLNNRIIQTIEGKSDVADSLMKIWPQVEWEDRDKRRATIALFLLEELDSKLSEISNHLFKNLDQGFRVFMNEFKAFTQTI